MTRLRPVTGPVTDLSSKERSDEGIAIVGMACIFPGAANLHQYWSNIQNGVCAIADVPESRWDKVFYDPSSTSADRFYCKKGGFVDDYVDFDPLQYGIMPKAAIAADPDQLLSLRVGVEALQDAGLWQEDFNKEKTGVIIGRGNYLSAGTLRLEQHVRLVQQTIQTLQDLIPTISQSQLATVREQIQSKLTPYGPDSAVGLIPNLVASRLANRLNLKGPAYTVDGACASALLAVEQSCQMLRRGDTDVMLAGGLHFTHDLTFWSTFCQLGALSRTETIRPLSAKADGILAGEGIGMMVLKRVSDAKRDGDRIYSIIHGVASASDGNSSSLLAPAVSGQLLALERAWNQCELNKDDIGLIEAHGTGTPAGDNTELETLKTFFGNREHQQDSADAPFAGIGSVKSMIGHTMPASGAAGLIKASLAVYHGVKPVTLQADEPNPLVEQTRFKLLDSTQNWKQARGERIAGVNAFGFGGINAHVVLSGHREDTAVFPSASLPPIEHEKAQASLPALLRLSASSQAALLEKLANANEEQLVSSTSEKDVWRLAIIEPNQKRLSLAKNIIQKGKAWHGRSQVFFSCEPLTQQGKTAFLFPGVDSEFNPQLKDVAEHFDVEFPKFCEKLNPATDLLKVGIGLTGVNKVLNQVMQKMDVSADAMAGHSIGEWSAMSASGSLSQTLIDEICSKMDPDSLEVPQVKFLAVAAGLPSVEGLYEDLEHLHLSHDNCPHQIIFCGKEAQIITLAERLKGQSILAQVLPIVSGFHSPLLADYAKPFTDFFGNVELVSPAVELWSANTAQPFPVEMEGKQEIAVNHLLQPVRFKEMLENMYEQGFRNFIQVGFGSLTGFVSDSLKSRPHFTFSANVAKRSGIEQLCHLAAGLWVEGAEPNLALVSNELSSAVNNLKESESQGDDNSTLKSKSTMRLSLGVPLLKLNEPLNLPDVAANSQRVSTTSLLGPRTSESASNDPLEHFFQQTLCDIQQASDDIRNVWQQRRTSAPTPVQQFVPKLTSIRKCLDLDKNIPYVLDHAFFPQRENWPVVADHQPVIPLTMEISLMRNAVLEAVPGMKVIALENVRAFNWLIVVDPVDIEIEVDHIQEHVAQVSIKGFAEARAILATEFPEAPKKIIPNFKNQRKAAIKAEQLYGDNWMFHGPAYQSIVELGPIADNGITGRLKVSSGEGALLDNMGQLAGYWVMEEETDCLAMPIGIEKIKFFSADPEVGDDLTCDILVRELDGESCITDQQLLDQHGAVRVVMEGWHTRRYTMDKRFWIHSKQIDKYLLSEPQKEGFVIFEDCYEKAITRDYLFKRYLNMPEREVYDAISPRRKRQWLNGRIAVKDAIRDFIWERQGKFDFFPKELSIKNDEAGKPCVSSHITDTYHHNVQVSIAHKDNYAVAIVSEKPVGIDIEKIEERSENFVDMTLLDSEVSLIKTGTTCASLHDELITRIWTAKEAVSKKMGTGLQGNIKCFVLEEVQGDRFKINGHWTKTVKHKDYIICWTDETYE